jgi:thymidine kinase
LNGSRAKVRAFKHADDRRYATDAIVSHDGQAFPATPVRWAREIEQAIVHPLELIGIDEGHFFDDELVRVVRRLAEGGVEVVLTALERGCWHQPMRVSGRLAAIADLVLTREARCARCAAPATRTQRLTPILAGDLVGGPERYEPRCTQCWHAPPEPMNPLQGTCLPILV